MPAKLRLYDDKDKYTSVGSDLDLRINDAVRPIIDEYVKAGYSPRDIQNVAQAAITDIVLSHLLGWT